MQNHSKFEIHQFNKHKCNLVSVDHFHQPWRWPKATNIWFSPRGHQRGGPINLKRLKFRVLICYSATRVWSASWQTLWNVCDTKDTNIVPCLPQALPWRKHLLQQVLPSPQTHQISTHPPEHTLHYRTNLIQCEAIPLCPHKLLMNNLLRRVTSIPKGNNLSAHSYWVITYYYSQLMCTI